MWGKLILKNACKERYPRVFACLRVCAFSYTHQIHFSSLHGARGIPGPDTLCAKNGRHLHVRSWWSIKKTAEIQILNGDISCGHTTDFYLGKTDLPRANSPKVSRGKFISGFVLPKQKILRRSHYWYRLPRFSRTVESFEELIQEGKMHGDLVDQRDVLFFYLAVISYATSTCKVKTGGQVDDSCPPNLFHNVSYVPFCHQDLRRWASIG